ncbi:gfo/Idh/MocA family oxidoreductase [Colwellia sp. 75C3]|uniref:Gfo/Idh/MocA family protein n=1 Tax=Colwellia sp. 75C3 TaxID=888425 RepID=UPI000C3403F1|nr:Gfo/Idh/MocA family oxidoreductase [Colwellia sp. 75C3]PKG84920.1 gfo/Idh/MocA family oxidoreductase [Colwellia sp. 75C3]
MTNFAVIGTSKITDAFIEAARQDARFNLVAVYSRHQQTAQAFADKHNITHCFTDLALLANSDLVDAVYIASPNNFHAQQSITLLNGGKHVLCEKPVAINCAELTKMVVAAKANNVTFMEAMLVTFLPNYHQIKKQLKALGNIRKYSASFCQLSSRYPAYLQGKNPNTFNLDFGNGALMDIGIYPLYLAIDLFGLPTEITGQCYKLPTGVDGYGDILLKYDLPATDNNQANLQAHISYSKLSNGSNICEIQGENGYLMWQHSSLFNEVSLHLNDGSCQTLTLTQTDNRMTYELSHFIDLIVSGNNESSVNSWQLSQQVLTVIEQARKQQGIIYSADKPAEN